MYKFLILLVCAILMACGKPAEYDLQPPKPQEVPAQLTQASPYAQNNGKFYLHYGTGTALAAPTLYRTYDSCTEAIRMLKKRMDPYYNNIWFECTPEFNYGP